ncbi:RHOMBOID-like protein 8 [Citrus sinensis]|nr:RHOMBOID-like protein 8 [Citrus sinensis]
MSTATLLLHQEMQPNSNASAMVAMDVSIYLGRLRVAVDRASNCIRVDNIVRATEMAMKFGILPGAGQIACDLQPLMSKFGVQLLQNAPKMPVYSIASATGFDHSIVVEKLLEQDNRDLVYDPATGKPAMADSASQLQTQIEIKQSHQEKELANLPIITFPETQGQEYHKAKAPFFKSRGRKRGTDTWVISVFVILHVVAFAATMAVNDCWRNSHGNCALKMLGRLSFQPISENPLLGPSASTLDQMGALRQTFLKEYHHTWRLFTCPWLHAGFIHLILNLGCIVLVGIHLEKEFGPVRIGIIYIFSAFVGSLAAALFVQNSPVVCASGSLFGLLGAMLSGLIRNWNFYTDKFAAIVLLFFVSTINFAIGLLPYIDNFSSIGGFISGFLLGFTLLFTPQTRIVAHSKAGIFEHNLFYAGSLDFLQQCFKD